MNRAAARWGGIVLSLSLALAGGCADGGVGGSGISGSATIQGNIEDIAVNGNAAPAAGGAAGFARVWVGVQGTDVSDVTAEDGSFVLVGPIAGDRVLEFRDSRLREPSTLNVTVLDGSVTRLKDVRIRGLRAVVDEVRVDNAQLALADDADCRPDGGALEAHEIGTTAIHLTVLIRPDTLIERSAGGALECSDLTRGSEIKVRGVLNSPREIIADVINRTKSGPPQR
jgi:hypothetical protein